MTGTSNPTPAPKPGATQLLTRLHNAEQSAIHWKAMARKHEGRAKTSHAEIQALKKTISTWRRMYRQLIQTTESQNND